MTYVRPIGLFGVLHGPRLADHGHLDMARVLQLLFDSLCDIPRKLIRLYVRYLSALNDDAHLASGLNSVCLTHAREGVRDSRQPREPLHVAFQQLTPGPGPGRRERVGNLEHYGLQAGDLYVLVVGGDRGYHLRTLTILLGQFGRNGDVSPFHVDVG